MNETGYHSWSKLMNIESRCTRQQGRISWCLGQTCTSDLILNCWQFLKILKLKMIFSWQWWPQHGPSLPMQTGLMDQLEICALERHTILWWLVMHLKKNCAPHYFWISFVCTVVALDHSHFLSYSLSKSGKGPLLVLVLVFSFSIFFSISHPKTLHPTSDHI